MKNFKCPLCHKTLNDIGVVSKATHTFNIESAEYSSIDNIEETIEYYCPACGDTLPFSFTDDFIKEVEEEKKYTPSAFDLEDYIPNHAEYIPRHAKKEDSNENM